jgi:branched-chain amino acid transport system permease protein
MPDLKPFIVSGLALGGVYALSGVGLVLLYRTTAVVNFAYGALGALAALVAWQLTAGGIPELIGCAAGVLAAIAVAVLYGASINSRLAPRGTAVASAGSLGAALVLLGACTLVWGEDVRTLDLATSSVAFTVTGVVVNLTEVLALSLAIVVVIAASVYLRRTLTGATMRALANDRELTAMLGVRVRRVELITWAAVGALAGLSGILFANLVTLQAGPLTFLVIASLGAAVIGRFRSLALAFLGGLVIGVLQACATPFAALTSYRAATPFAVAIVTLLALDLARTSHRPRRA